MHKLLPEQTVITFDLHGVLFTTDYWKFLTILWQSSHAFVLIIHMFYPKVWVKCFRLWRQSSPIEKYIMELTQCSSLAFSKNTLIALANAQKPNDELITLVRILKTRGYELHIFSNIGTIILAHLSSLFPEILSLFDHIFTTDAPSGYLSKRNDLFFKAYVRSHHELSSKQIIFIDDCKKNLMLGRKNNMITIYAKNTKEIKKKLTIYLFDNLL